MEEEEEKKNEENPRAAGAVPEVAVATVYQCCDAHIDSLAIGVEPLAPTELARLGVAALVRPKHLIV